MMNTASEYKQAVNAIFKMYSRFATSKLSLLAALPMGKELADWAKGKGPHFPDSEVFKIDEIYSLVIYTV